MNVEITTFLQFQGTDEELSPLLEQFADAVVQLGCGNDPIETEESVVRSAIFLTSFQTEEEVKESLAATVEKSFRVLLPYNKEEKDE